MTLVGLATLAPAAGPERATRFEGFAPLVSPLATHYGMTASFGEPRSRRFHGGIDFSTGETIGREVRAPAAAWVERIRASGAGYGRSLYLRTADGLLLVFGHLDAFAEPLASFVAAAQESSLQYEQDLTPAPGRFAFAAGDRIAWSGESGAGPPHLHLEVRRGDMNLNPLRAGLELPDAAAPRLIRLTLEPLDDTSYVERGAAPRTIALAGTPETLLVEGRARAWLETRDGDGVKPSRMAPYLAAMEWNGARVECRLDSVAWGEENAEADWVFDAERRAAPATATGLWYSEDFRPVVFGRASARDAGTLAIEPDAPPRALVLEAADVAGHVVRRTVWVRGPRLNERGPSRASGAPARNAARRWEWSVLPGRRVRATLHGAPGGLREVRAEVEGDALRSRPATFHGGRWSSVLPFEGLAGPCAIRFMGTTAGGAPWEERTRADVVPLGRRPDAFGAVVISDASRQERFEWQLPPGGAFEPVLLFAGAIPSSSAGGGLAPRSGGWRLEPVSLPLRKAAIVRIHAGALPADRRIGIGVRDRGGWAWLGGVRDSTGAWSAETPSLGTFALLADTLAPSATLLRSARRGRGIAYPRWELEARVVEWGSGVDAAASYFLIDGARVPTEWDVERRRMRWRPRQLPASGAHTVEIVVVDRVGNTRRASGRFVLD